MVCVASRQVERALQVCDEVRKVVPNAKLVPWMTDDEESVGEALVVATVVIAAGAPAVELLPDKRRRQCDPLKVAIDLNAMPPSGLGGIQPQDKAVERDGQICYGAIGVGGTKMKLHKAALRRLFEANDLVLNAEEIYELGKTI